eukprot:SAG31_NODE_3323_length_4411_cov_1.853432_3_plen_89_part_00
MSPRNSQPKHHYLPSQHVAEIVGHKNENIRKIQHQTGTRIIVMPTCDHHPSNAFRLVTILGNADQANKARGALDELANKVQFGAPIKI